jgi:nucleotide-binding universal stress UspA family protein
MDKTTLKEIVVTIDFSEESMNALRFALVFIKKIHANISLVYVINKKNNYIIRKGIDEHAWAKEKLENLISKFQVRLKHGKFSYHIFEGTIHQEVIRYANSIKAFTIITSTHGISGFKEFIIGNNANKIVTGARGSVITVKDHSCSRSISRIVLPIDRTVDTLQKVPLAADIAKKHNAEIHVLLLDSLDTIEAKEQLMTYSNQAGKYLDNLDVKYVESFLTGDDFPRMILDYSKLIKADLIVIMSEQELRAKNLFLGPFAQQIVNISAFPVLVYRVKNLYRMPGLHAMPSSW